MIDVVEALAQFLDSYVFYGVDVSGNIYVYIDGLDALRDKRFYIDLTGRGVSVEDAAFSFVKLLLDHDYILRSKRKPGYITRHIRSFVLCHLQILRLEEKRCIKEN